MCSKPRISSPTAVRRLSSSSRRLRKRQLSHSSSASIRGGASSVSGKLEALRNLIPSETADAYPDQLLRETADYIVLLTTQVLVLQKLVDFYGSQSQEDCDCV